MATRDWLNSICCIYFRYLGSDIVAYIYLGRFSWYLGKYPHSNWTPCLEIQFKRSSILCIQRLFWGFIEKSRVLFVTLINFFGNLAMFIPIGFFSALLFRNATLKRSAIIGFGMSTFIEFAQYFIMRNTAVDDIILNTLGAICGYWVYRLLRKMFPGFSRKFICNITQAAGNWWLCRWKGPFDLNVIIWYQPLYPNKEKYCISPPREDNVHLLNRRGSIWTHQNLPLYRRLSQRKNKQGAEAHVFMLAGAGKFSTTIDWNEHPSVGCRVGVPCITQALWRICDTFPALSWGNFNAASGMLQTRLIHNHKYFKKGA